MLIKISFAVLLKHTSSWPSADVKPMLNDLVYAMAWQGILLSLCVWFNIYAASRHKTSLERFFRDKRSSLFCRRRKSFMGWPPWRRRLTCRSSRTRSTSLETGRRSATACRYSLGARGFWEKGGGGFDAVPSILFEDHLWWLRDILAKYVEGVVKTTSLLSAHFCVEILIR